jgi:hypothetical protein
MLLSADSTIAFPRELVFRTYRDKLVELVEFMPNIRRIEVRSREETGSITRFVNEWQAGGDIPAAARVVLSESMLSWTDHASWDERDFTCAWRIETHSFREAVSCSGKNRFIEQGGETRLEIRGELSIDVSRIKGVPKFLGKSVSKTVTEFLIKKVTPNLFEASAGLRRYLEKRQRS